MKFYTKGWAALAAAGLLLGAGAAIDSSMERAAYAYAESTVTVTLDRNEAKPGDTLQISGRYTPAAWVSLRVLDAGGAVLAFDAVRADSGGGYRFVFTVPAEAEGRLRVLAGSGADVAAAELTVREGNGGGGQPGESPGPTPSASPSAGPTGSPGTGPSATPSGSPGTGQSAAPSATPTAAPSTTPTATPSAEPGGDSGGWGGVTPAASPRASAAAAASASTAAASAPVSAAGGVLTYALQPASGAAEALVDEAALKRVWDGAGGIVTVKAETAGTAPAAVTVRLTPGAAAFWQAQAAADARALRVVAAGLGSFTLPAEVLAGEPAGGRALQVRIAPASAGQLRLARAAAEAQGYSLLHGPVEYAAEWTGATGSPVQPVNFGRSYAERTLALPGPVDAGRAGMFRLDPASGRFAFVPGVFTAADGAASAVMRRPGGGLHAVLSGGARAFRDVPGTHPARAEIERLSGLGLVLGTPDGRFEPSRAVTRAEFTALLVRALGLDDRPGAAPFRDVPASGWYAGPVGAAQAAGLAAGYADGSFRPSGAITRQEMASLLTKALRFAGWSPEAAASAATPAGFTDAGQIGGWANAAVNELAASGLIQGRMDGSFGPQAPAARAEVAAVISRMLKAAGFVNP